MQSTKLSRHWMVGPALVALLAAAAAPQSAAAQTAPATERPGDVVVTGRSKEETGAQVRDFVRALSQNHFDQPLARFGQDKLCLQIWGLEAAYLAAVEARMRQVAAVSGIGVAAQGCKPADALVMFVADKGATERLLEKRYPGLFLDPHGDPVHVHKEPGRRWRGTSMPPPIATGGAWTRCAGRRPSTAMRAWLLGSWCLFAASSTCRSSSSSDPGSTG